MSRWFRFYDGALDDPKVQRLPPNLFKVWVNLLCVASRNDGVLPTQTDLAFLLRLPDDAVAEAIRSLVDAGLLDEGESLSPHNWSTRQHKSDDSKERVRRYRESKRNADVTVTVTPPDTETETEAEEDNEAIASSSDPVAEMVEIYHDAMCPSGCPRVIKITPPRKASALQRLKDCGGMEGWRMAMGRARASPFLTGASSNGWKADFDFFLQAKSFTKLLEGSYDARTPAPGQRGDRVRPGADVALDVANELLGRHRDAGGGPSEFAGAIDAHRHGAGVYRVSG